MTSTRRCVCHGARTSGRRPGGRQRRPRVDGVNDPVASTASTRLRRFLFAPSVLQPLAADWKPRPGAYSLKLTDGRPTGFRSTPSPRRPLVLAPRQKHRERKESYTHILTRQRLHVAVLVPLVEHVHAVSSGSAHVINWLFPIFRLIL